MIRTFATVPGLRVALMLMACALLEGAASVHAQQDSSQQDSSQQGSTQQPSAQQQPEQQQPDTHQSGNQQSGSQEASPEESIPIRKPKPRRYKKWVFNAGGGANLTDGTTKTYVRSGGGIAAGGAARNLSPYFGLRLDFQFDNLPLRASALQLAQAPSGNSHVYSFTLDPIINIPVTKVWSGYVVFGPSFYHRTGKLDSSTAIPGSGCNGFWTWWGRCYAGSLPLNGDFLTASQNEFGENLGGGVARKVRSNIEVYAEFRYFHGSHDGTTTDLRPITVGVRW